MVSKIDETKVHCVSLWAAPTEVRTNKHNDFLISLVLLSTQTDTEILLEKENCGLQNGGWIRPSKDATTFSFWLYFVSSSTQHLLGHCEPLTVLEKLVLTTAACSFCEVTSLGDCQLWCLTDNLPLYWDFYVLTWVNGKSNRLTIKQALH